METTVLSELAVKGNCKVFKVTGDRAIKKRLLEMGFVKGTEIYVQKVAPLGDPMELVLKGYHLSLRRQEAKDVHVYREVIE
ncbi:MAG: ferrous iron transport protein A [Candidatus Omnitrophica bacterium]|nr:ferrous iron transport protein A [Candidatus Omnitrophota bacterium]